MSFMVISTLNLNPRMIQIGIRCSGTKKCSQRYEINQTSEMPPETPPELRARPRRVTCLSCRACVRRLARATDQ